MEVASAGSYTISVSAPGFRDAVKTTTIDEADARITVPLTVAAEKENVRVVADAPGQNVLFPDQAQKMYVRDETLDANPDGRVLPWRYPDCRPKQRPALLKRRNTSLRGWLEITESRSLSTFKSVRIWCRIIYLPMLTETATPTRTS